MSEEIKDEITVGASAARPNPITAEGKTLVDAKAALDTTSRDMRSDAKETMKKAMYQKAQPRQRTEDAAAGELSSKMLGINRITKVVKGGRTLRFNALVVVGDKQGRVAVGTGKAREVTEAIKKAEADAKKTFKTVPIVGTTIPHEVLGHFGSSKVKMIPSKEGNGIIAGGAVRAVLELAGYKDVTAKCYGSTNKTNVVKAAMDALLQLRTKQEIANLRGVAID